MKIRIMLISAVLVLLCACSPISKDADDEVMTVYDLTRKETSLAPSRFLIDDDGDVSEKVRVLLQRIIDGPNGDRTRSAVPGSVTSVNYTIGHRTVSVDLDASFNAIPGPRRILCEAAIVRTLCQLDEVYAVSFFADGIPIVDQQNIPVGLLTPESFVENDASMINAYEQAQLRLYFADESGQMLIEKTENVTYNSNIPMDRLIVDKVIEGPLSTDAFETINPSTTVNSVMTQDGVCYVNLSSDFLNKITNVTDEVMIYSLVDSLTELGNVNRVRILIDGDAGTVGDYDLSSFFERNLEMIK